MCENRSRDNFAKAQVILKTADYFIHPSTVRIESGEIYSGGIYYVLKGKTALTFIVHALPMCHSPGFCTMNLTDNVILTS